MKIKISISGVTNNLVAVEDFNIEVDYTAEEVVTVIGAYKDLIPVILAAMEKSQSSI